MCNFFSRFAEIKLRVNLLILFSHHTSSQCCKALFFFFFARKKLLFVVFPAFPMDAGRVLSYHSFPLSSELRKHWLVALRRDQGANSRVSESTVLCSEHFLRKIFTFLLVPKSLWALPLPIIAKQGKLVAP